MSLEERLRLLRSGAVQQPAAEPRDTLKERLRRLAPSRQRPLHDKPPDETALAAVLGAEPLAPGVLRVRERFALGERHGRIRLGDCLAALPGLMGEGGGQPADWVFLDTETSGLAGGTGTWAFLCGLLRFEPGGLTLTQYLLCRLDAEAAYLDAIASELQTARLLVSYNGKTFDGPLLATRFRLAGLAADIGGKEHLDLLYHVRRAFAAVWQDCRLATAERVLLGFVREGDLLGSEAPDVWLAWLRQGELAGMRALMKHNRWDLLSLPALVRPLRESFLDPASTGADVQSVARFHLARGDADLALELLSANRGALAPAALLALAALHRRLGQWPAAAEIWEGLAQQGVPEAVEALAKYLEHRERDYEAALRWVRRLPEGPAREHRRRRVEDKLAVQRALEAEERRQAPAVLAELTLAAGS